MYLKNCILLFLAASFTACAVVGQTSTDDASSKKWDVTAPFAPTRTVEFSTQEGTWMSVDVSPDGKSIVFDLLGDLYLIPITGGKATRLTNGPAYDVQPTYSPDGSRIAFTSDRGGGDNIWTMNADGTDVQQITKENFRLLNGPAWTPDGEYILARKHFSSTRSLGAGEIWMYHASGQGASGLQLTERKNDQQDQGNEIALSPDGRYIYFSEDVSGGSTFQYNKDPNSQIYAIRRLDRETGKFRNLITGPGGSARPTPSPDGKEIAFVRRIRAKSVVHVYDVETGAVEPLFDGLDHDQMEAWAIFGVYPRMSWTPDGRHLVFWAGGKIRKLDVVSKSVQEVPFEVDVELTVSEAARFPIEVHPERFEAKMIRDAVTSPDGKTLVFHAAGHLWKKALPDGRPERLTTDDDHFEYEPSYSPDGSTIVYTTWDDEELAAVVTIPSAGGNPVVLSTRKGYYSDPRFSSDGLRIVYVRGAGGGLLGNLHGIDPGIYWISVEGGEGHLVREGGRKPRFGPEDKRIYFLSGGGLSKEYKSVRLDGGDERTHLKLRYANTVEPSPDWRWVAFNELFNAYLSPFPKTGSAVDLNKDTKAIPVRKITRDVGTELHWSSDSRSLHWMIGPEYFTRDLKDSFTFVDGAPEDLPAIDTTGTRIGLTLESDVPSGSVAFVGARIITMNGDEIIDNGTIVVDGNRIAAVGPATEVTVPSDAHRVDASGQTIIPGLVDAHAHLGHFFSGSVPQENHVYYANLAFGVTTAHDPSADTETVFTLSEMVRTGKIVGPRIFSTGTILYGADGDFKAIVDSLGDARSHIRRMKAVGAISVKSYNQPRREQRQQILKAARELEMMVVPEGGSTFFHNMTMVWDGHTGIEHNVPVAPLYEDVLSAWAETDVGYTPTLVVAYGGPSGENYWYQHTNVWENERLLKYMPRRNIDSRSRRRVKIPEEEYFHIEVAASGKKLIDRGITVQIGAHGQLQGLAAHWEMWMFEQGGMTPHEALRSATLHGARYLGLDGDLGSIEPGKLADLVVIHGDPLADLRQSENISLVMVNGRLYDTATMDEIGNRPRKRGSFWFERQKEQLER